MFGSDHHSTQFALVREEAVIKSDAEIDAIESD